MRQILSTLMLLLICEPALSRGTLVSPSPNPPSTGNFSLPTAQQLGPLVSLGQNIIDKGNVQLIINPEKLARRTILYEEVFTSLTFGISDRFSALVAVPIATELKKGNATSSGLEDMSVQFEYAYYNNQTCSYIDQATLVTNFTLPSGSASKNPPTGYGAPTYLIAGTFNRMYTDWYAFTSPGIILTPTHQGVKSGTQYLYQFGLGQTIDTKPNEWVLAWLVELDGEYTEKTKIHGRKNPNSGGNIAFLTPSLFYSTKPAYIQAGFGLPVFQRLYGNQKKAKYSASIALSITFY